MDRQSDVHLEFGFWIEWTNLGPWDGRFLTIHSLEKVRDLYLATDRKESESIKRMAGVELKRKRSACPLNSVPIVATTSNCQSESTQSGAKRIKSPSGLPSTVFAFCDVNDEELDFKPPSRPPQKAPAYSASLLNWKQRGSFGPSESKRKAMKGN